jgi:hypothetical protein
MAAIKGLLGIIPPKSPAFRSDNATNREDSSGAGLQLLAHDVAGAYWCVAWRVAGSEQVGRQAISAS